MTKNAAVIPFTVAADRARTIKAYLETMPEIGSVTFPMAQPMVSSRLAQLEMHLKHPENAVEFAHLRGIVRRLEAIPANRLHCALA